MEKQSIIDEIPKQSRHLNLSQEKIITEPIVNKKLIKAKGQICSLFREEDIFKQTKNEPKETGRIHQMKTELSQILNKDKRIKRILIPSTKHNCNARLFMSKVQKKMDSQKENIQSNGKYLINKTTIYNNTIDI